MAVLMGAIGEGRTINLANARSLALKYAKNENDLLYNFTITGKIKEKNYLKLVKQLFANMSIAKNKNQKKELRQLISFIVKQDKLILIK
jgi:hypothetical protein